MRIGHASSVVLALAMGTTIVEARCFDTGHSIRCPPGCELLKRPRFSGDSFSWRCRRPSPPPTYSYQQPPASCPPGTYPVTREYCCPFGTYYSSGQCRAGQRERTYQASGSDEPTGLLILAAIAVGIFAWWQNRSAQVAYARESADIVHENEDIVAATQRMQEAADLADELLKKFRNKKDGNP